MQLTRHKHKLGNIVVIKFKLLEFKQVLYVAQASGNQVVHANNMIPFFYKSIAEM